MKNTDYFLSTDPTLADEIITKSLISFEALKNEKHGRFKSWEHCYKAFKLAWLEKKLDDETLNYLALHLAFYLASWGMYRGSSFLPQCDYTVHIPVVKELMRPENKSLVGINPIDYKNPDNQVKFLELKANLITLYDDIRKSVRDSESKVTDTLITKVLLGTLGCVPAYDTFFKAAMRKLNIFPISFNLESILALSEYYERHHDKFEKSRKKMSTDDLDYPPMKILDGCFWKMGYDLMTLNGTRKA